jgi:hypothetical protein
VAKHMYWWKRGARWVWKLNHTFLREGCVAERSQLR